MERLRGSELIRGRELEYHSRKRKRRGVCRDVENR